MHSHPIRHFLNVLYGKTDRFHIPTNLEHGIWQLCGKISIFYEDFGSSILSLSLTLNPAFSGKTCRRSRLKRSRSGEPVNAYVYLIHSNILPRHVLLYERNNVVYKGLKPCLSILRLLRFINRGNYTHQGAVCSLLCEGIPESEYL